MRIYKNWKVDEKKMPPHSNRIASPPGTREFAEFWLSVLKAFPASTRPAHLERLRESQWALQQGDIYKMVRRGLKRRKS